MPRAAKPEDVYRLAVPTDPQLSPDGAHVAFTVTRARQAADGYFRSVWLARTDGQGDARRVTMGGKSVRLTPKEFDLLRFLVSHPDKPIPHRKLLQTVWGPDYGDEVEYLRVFVNQLRKKIEPVPSKPRYLLTEPWVGYRFAPK